MKPQHYRFKNYINNIVNIRNLIFWSKNTCPSDRRKPISQKIVVRQNQDLIKFDLRQHKELHVYHRTSTST